MARGSRWGACILILCVAGSCGYAAGERAGALGILAGPTPVEVNEQLLAPGAALFPGDVVRTRDGATAVLELRTGLSARLEANGEAVVEGGRQLELRRGALTLRTAAGERTRVRVLGAEVEVRGEGGFPALCTLAAVGRGAAVLNSRGVVEIRGAGAVRRLAPGQMARLEAGPQAPGTHAGQVSAAIPSETIQHYRQPLELPLKVTDPVAWEDLVTTEKTGRVRIALEDGSFLNIGARSQMRITKHDPKTQQTEIELTVGRLRGEVVKLSKPNAELKVKTPTAVIGVVGTVFVVLATPQFTRVWCLEGAVTVQSLSAAGTVTLHAGESTIVRQGAPPSQAEHAPLQQMLNAVSATSAGEPLAPQVGQALTALGATPAQVSTAGTVVMATTNLAMSTTTVAAGAVSATVGGVAITRVDSATSTLNAAATTLGEAAAASNAAASAANAATAAANGAAAASAAAGSALNTIIQSISPSQPCGCQ